MIILCATTNGNPAVPKEVCPYECQWKKKRPYFSKERWGFFFSMLLVVHSLLQDSSERSYPMKKLVILLIGITIVMSMSNVTTVNVWQDIAIGLVGGIIGYSTGRQDAAFISGDQSPSPSPGCDFRPGVP